MKTARLNQILRQFANQNILVIGDVMLDHFIWGRVSRISPEAPVPVVEVQRESLFPGGAANVARNLRALTGQVTVLGSVGTDVAGEQLCQLLRDQGVTTAGLVVDPDRPTTVKTRVVAQHQQVVRFDKEQTQPLRPALQQQLLKNFEAQLPTVAAVIFEDYGKGLLTQPLLNAMHRAAQRAGKITAADPNARHLLRYIGLTAVTPNRSEAFAAAGLTNPPALDDVLADAPLMKCGEKLLRQWQPKNLLITLGEHGMCVYSGAASRPIIFPRSPRKFLMCPGRVTPQSPLWFWRWRLARTPLKPPNYRIMQPELWSAKSARRPVRPPSCEPASNSTGRLSYFFLSVLSSGGAVSSIRASLAPFVTYSAFIPVVTSASFPNFPSIVIFVKVSTR